MLHATSGLTSHEINENIKNKMHDLREFQTRLQTVLREYSTQKNLQRVSLYFGFGIGWALIKAEAFKEDYFLIGEIINKLNKELLHWGFSTTTYLATEPAHFESDNISEDSLATVGTNKSDNALGFVTIPFVKCACWRRLLGQSPASNAGHNADFALFSNSSSIR